MPSATANTPAGARLSTADHTAYVSITPQLSSGELYAAMLDLAHYTEDAPAILEAWRPGPCDQVVRGTRATACLSTKTVVSSCGSTIRKSGPARKYVIMRGISLPRRSTPRPATAILYHEPQIVYALDPEIAAGDKRRSTQKYLARRVHRSSSPAIAARINDGTPQAKASVPTGVVIKGHYNGKIDSPRISSKALTRLEIETMKAGAQPGRSERQQYRTDRKALENRSSRLGIFPTASTPSSARIRGLTVRRHHRQLPDPGHDRLQLAGPSVRLESCPGAIWGHPFSRR